MPVQPQSFIQKAFRPRQCAKSVRPCTVLCCPLWICAWNQRHPVLCALHSKHTQVTYACSGGLASPMMPAAAVPAQGCSREPTWGRRGAGMKGKPERSVARHRSVPSQRCRARSCRARSSPSRNTCSACMTGQHDDSASCSSSQQRIEGCAPRCTCLQRMRMSMPQNQ
jgi:hypothetical protein